MPKFDYTLDVKTIDFRQQPELDLVGKGEQDVLLVQPYNSEILTGDLNRQQLPASLPKKFTSCSWNISNSKILPMGDARSLPLLDEEMSAKAL